MQEILLIAGSLVPATKHLLTGRRSILCDVIDSESIGRTLEAVRPQFADSSATAVRLYVLAHLRDWRSWAIMGAASCTAVALVAVLREFQANIHKRIAPRALDRVTRTAVQCERALDMLRLAKCRSSDLEACLEQISLVAWCVVSAALAPSNLRANPSRFTARYQFGQYRPSRVPPRLAVRNALRSIGAHVRIALQAAEKVKV